MELDIGPVIMHPILKDDVFVGPKEELNVQLESAENNNQLPRMLEVLNWVKAGSDLAKLAG